MSNQQQTDKLFRDVVDLRQQFIKLRDGGRRKREALEQHMAEEIARLEQLVREMSDHMPIERIDAQLGLIQALDAKVQEVLEASDDADAKLVSRIESTEQAVEFLPQKLEDIEYRISQLEETVNDEDE